jgi:CPA2 family monovalent cation:H+ antiporter-2
VTSTISLLAAGTSGDVLVELGAVLLVLAALGRIAARFSLPSIPLYLTAGLLLGEGSLFPLDASSDFIRVGADVGVVMLLLLPRTRVHARGPPGGAALQLACGHRRPRRELRSGPRRRCHPRLVVDGDTAARRDHVHLVVGIIAKLLSDLDRLANRETPIVLAVLVIEDIAMAVFLPVIGVLIVGSSPLQGVASVVVALAVVVAALFVSVQYSVHVSRLLDTRSAELLLLTVLGLTFLVAGLAEELQVSAAVGAFLLGVTISGQVAERGREMLEPIRDVFGGLFFVFFGLQIDPATLTPMLLPAFALAGVTAVTKGSTGWWAAGRMGIGRRGRLRTAMSLVPRGEFSIVIAGIGVASGLEPDIGPLAACYVLILAVAGSLAIRFADRWPLPGAPAPTRRAEPVPGKNVPEDARE